MLYYPCRALLTYIYDRLIHNMESVCSCLNAFSFMINIFCIWTNVYIFYVSISLSQSFSLYFLFSFLFQSLSFFLFAIMYLFFCLALFIFHISLWKILMGKHKNPTSIMPSSLILKENVLGHKGRIRSC